MKITIARPNQWADRLRAYRIVVDGKEMGEIRAGEARSFQLSDADHEIRARIDWCGSNTVSVRRDSEHVHLECENSFFGWRALLPWIPIYYVTFRRGKYLTLKEKSQQRHAAHACSPTTARRQLIADS